MLKQYYIEAPMITVCYNGITEVVNEYTARNLQLAVVKKELDYRLLTIDGNPVEPTGFIKANIPSYGIIARLISDVWKANITN